MLRGRVVGARLPVLALVAVLLVVLPAQADPEVDTSRLDRLESQVDELEASVDEREAELEELDDHARELRDDQVEAQERLDEIEAELSLAVERYNEAVVELETVQAERAATAAELDALGEEVAALSETVANHAVRLHKIGPSLEVAALLGGGDPAELGYQTTTLRLILSGEQADLQQLSAAQERVDALEVRLAEQEAAAALAAEQVEAELVLVQAAYDRHEDELERLTAVLAEVESVEAAQRAALESEQEELAELRSALEDERESVEAQREQAQREQAASGGSSSGSSGGSAGGSGGSSSDQSAAAPRRSAQVAVDTALAQVGKPYRWGATGPNAFDCSGLTSYAWAAAGVSIPRTSSAQYAGLTNVSRSELQPGDLVFYNSPISHVAMYVGGDTIVEASRAGVPVRTASLSRRTPVGYARP